MLDKRIEKAEEVLKNAKENVKGRYRLGYHIMAPANWINDPNGLIQYKGEYHASINIILMMKTGDLCIGDMLKVRI